MPDPVRIVFLGGLGEIGRNCMAIEQGVGPDRRILLIDCGLMFPGPDLHGIDLVLPDFTYLRENADRIDAVVATHGHEDHVGGLQFLLREISFPIYASALTLGLARHRIEEAGLLGQTEMIPVADGERRRIGAFDVEFIPVTHSVPHAHAVAVHTPQGVILHSGDFKLDLTPVDDRRTDLARIGQLAKTTGIRVLLADSTNAEKAGYAPSERSIGRVLRSLFAEQRDRRIITASFASHLHRIQQIADAAIDCGRKVCTLGLSVRKNVLLAMDLGIIHIPPSSYIDVEDIDRYPPGEVCVISTGSQGEPMSALALLARGENKFVKLSEHDTVILSSHAIPGNESNVNRVMDGLLKAGAIVIHSGIQDVHATGHAQADELKTYLSIAQPEWYVPIHGEFRHLVANAALAEVMGIAGTRCSCARTATCSRSPSGASRWPGGSPPATCTWTGSSVMSAPVYCVTAGCSPARASSSSWSRSTPRRARCSSGRRSSLVAGCTHPRPRICSTRPVTRLLPPSSSRWRRGSRTSRRSSATSAAPPVDSSASAPAAGR